eukprot:401087-Rhodomonas_salina.2
MRNREARTQAKRPRALAVLFEHDEELLQVHAPGTPRPHADARSVPPKSFGQCQTRWRATVRTRT